MSSTHVSGGRLEEHEEKGQGVPVKAVVGVLVVVCIAVSMVAGFVLTINAGEAAVRDTEDANKKGADDVLAVVVSAMESRVDELLTASTRSAKNTIKEQLELAFMVLNTLTNLAIGADASSLTWSFIDGLGPKLWSDLQAYRPHGVFSVGIGNIEGHLKMFTSDPSGALTMRTNTSSTGTMLSPYSSESMMTTAPSTDDPITPFQVPFMKHASEDLHPGSVGWSPFQSHDGYYSSILGTSVGTIAATRCYIGVYVDVNSLTHILRNATNMIDAEARAFVVVTISNTLVAVSHGTATTPQVTGRRVNESDDSVIQALGATIGNKWSDYTNMKVVEIDGTAHHYVRTADLQSVNPNTKQPTNLNLWVVASINKEYISSKVDAIAATYNTHDDEAREGVWSDLDDRKTIILVIVPIVGLLLAGVMIFLAHEALKTFTGLQQDMAKVGDMQFGDDDDLPGGYSMVVELGDMQHSFMLMRRRLREYKSFVPSSLLVGSEIVGGAAAEPPTGSNVAFVFTDIQGSTSLWEMSPESMNEAMDTHNRVIRSAINTCEGYEVKTIGDAFMASFGDPVNACKFALTATTNLVKQRWPKALRLDAIKDSNGTTIWKGLRLRMGAHYGEAIPEVNILTGRTDYKGKAVAIAAKAETVAKGGTVCCTSDFVDVCKERFGELGKPAILAYGDHKVKGTTEAIPMFLMAPAKLKARMFEDPSGHNIEMPVINDSRTTATSVSGATTTDTRDHGRRAGPTGLASAMNTQTASVAIVRPDDMQMKAAPSTMFAKYNIIIKTVAEVAQQTDGVIVSFTGSEITVAWNTTRQVRLHTLSSVRFISYLTRRGLNIVSCAGTGDLHFGNVGTASCRYPIVHGVAAAVAGALTGYSSDVGVPSMVADCTSESSLAKNQTLQPFIRPVDKWAFGEKKVDVYELCTGLVLSAIEGDWRDEDTAVGDGLAPMADYKNAYRSAVAVNANLASLKELCERYPNDVSLQAVLGIVTNGKWRPGYRAVNFSTVFAPDSQRLSAPPVIPLLNP